MSRKRVPKQFGRRPILMQRYCGGLRIIYPDGRVEFSLAEITFEETKKIYPRACTSSKTQKEAYEAAVVFDRPARATFLGYL